MKMKRKFLYLFVVIGVLVLSSCTSIKVSTDYDKSVDFSEYKTFEYYGWAEQSDKILNDLDERRIESAFAKEFKSRNIKLVESDGDLIVTLYIVTEEKTQTTAHTTSMGGYGGYYGYGPRYGWGPSMGYSSTTYNNYDYTVGTLIIDVYDAKNERLIWESIGVKTVDADPSTRDESIAKSVAAIMKPYPIAPIKE